MLWCQNFEKSKTYSLNILQQYLVAFYKSNERSKCSYIGHGNFIGQCFIFLKF